MKEDIKKRDSNLECCRIITMAIIVLNHVVSHNFSESIKVSKYQAK